MGFVLLQGFLRTEASGGWLLAGSSASLSLHKASGPGKQGGRPPPSPWLVDPSGRREQGGVGSDSSAAAGSGGRGGRASPAGLHEFVATWPWGEEHLGDGWLFPHKPSCGCSGLRSGGPGLHLRAVRTPLVFRGPDVSGRSPLPWGLFRAFSPLFCPGWTSIFAIPSEDCPWTSEQGIGMALEDRGFTALTSCSRREGGRRNLRPGGGI